MSYLAHNCVCGHPFDLHAPFGGPANKPCSTSTCDCRKPEEAESIILETITANREPTELAGPGVSTGGYMASCRCQECAELFDAS